MAVVFFEGFETVGTETGSGNATTTRPRVYKRFVSESGSNDGHLIDDVFSEGFAWSNNSGDQTMTFHHVLPTSVHGNPHDGSSHVLICGFRVHVPSNTTRDMDFRFVGQENGTLVTDAITLQIVDSQDLVIRRGSTAGTQLGSTVEDAFTPDTWHYVEIKVKVAEAANGGLVRVNVDGVEVFSFDGDTNVFSAINTNDIDYLRILFRTLSHSATDGDYWALDDIYVLDTDGESAPYDDFFGAKVRVLSLPPDADGTTNDWDTSTGTDHFSLIDENGADAADYIETSTDTEQDMFEFTDSASNGSFLALKVEAEAIAITTTTHTLDVRVDSGGNIVETNWPVTNTASYEVFEHYQTLDPAGGSWDQSSIGAAEVGVQFNT